MEASLKLKEIIREAVALKASDVHLLPDEESVRVRFRLDGQLIDVEKVALPAGRKLISHMKFIAGMDIGERRRPQNKRIEILMEQRTIFIRLSTFPSSLMETLVLRIFPYEKSDTLRELALFPDQVASLQKLIHSPHGLILLCGPTGAGKTTTLYSLLQDRMSSAKENIMTLEDPVERRENGLLQMEINEKAGVTYASGLRSLLRHDPDLIVIGEIRDEETAAIAVKAAMSGHLVISSLHSSSTAGALRRLKDLGIDEADLQEVLCGVAAQRLVDVKCPFCTGECSIHCRRRRLVRRKAIYEILMEEELQEAFDNLKKGSGKKVPRIDLGTLMKKGIAVGYIAEDEWKRFGKGAYL
ncbi:competence type IV pilus ATPase ComGA [Alkalicoccus saliphilus]|jgi:competence protein ComGA|uniref:Type II secretion system protein E n=1 Tax=Alkalicoccus saliphilus TaxID=200989 RepID=A0A2T4UAR8_9BACI|nr:competence type IV pilus ATPase ComGA [Alkalicoccus saliphilus]PTL40490.1 type II secretion system protein E [Alkalicoccus saliphilus]